MDAHITPDLNTYRLVHKATGAIEATGLGRVAAKDLQNRLWAQGTKTTVEVEPAPVVEPSYFVWMADALGWTNAVTLPLSETEAEAFRGILARLRPSETFVIDLAPVVEPAQPAPVETPAIVREFSPAGPCLTLGRLKNETAKFYCYEEWKGGDVFGRLRKVSKSGRAHVEPCRSCRDHAATVYPNGYMD